MCNFIDTWGARQVKYSCERVIFILRHGFLMRRHVTAKIMKGANAFWKEKYGGIDKKRCIYTMCSTKFPLQEPENSIIELSLK